MPKNKARLLLIGLLALAFILRSWNNSKMSFFGDYDEYFTAKTVAGIYEQKLDGQPYIDLAKLRDVTYSESIQDANRDNGNSFLYNLLLHYYSRVAGTGDIPLRFFSAFFDLLSILMIWLIGRHIKVPDNRILLACFLFTFYPVMVNYGGIIRTYSFTTAMCLLLVWLTLRAGREGKRLQEIVFIGLVGAAVFLGHYLTFYFLGALFLYAVFKFRKDRTRSGRVIGGLTVSGLICGIFLLVNFTRLTNFTNNNERYRNLTTKSVEEGNKRKLEEINVSTLTPKVILYFDQFYTGNTYALKWVQALTNEKTMLICGAVLLIVPLLLLLSIGKSETSILFIRLCFFLIISSHLSAFVLSFVSGHMIPLGIKYTMFSIPFFIMPVCFFFKSNMITRIALFIVAAGSLFTSAGHVPSKGNKSVYLQFEGDTKTYQSSEHETFIAKLQEIIGQGSSDTLFVKTETDLVFVEMSGIDLSHRVGYIQENDSLQRHSEQILPFSFRTPD